MSKTNDVRAVVKTKLSTVCDHVYFENADKDNLFPHITYSISPISTTDGNRFDCIVDMDVWDKSTANIEDLCDSIEALFDRINSPQTTILPTFYLVNRIAIKDDDKSIKHRLVRVQVQYYVR